MDDTINKVTALCLSVKKNLECAICLDLLCNPVSTKCNHQFCRDCINQAFSKGRRDAHGIKCPMCNASVSRRSLNEKPELAKIVEAMNTIVFAFEKDTELIGAPIILPCSQRRRSKTAPVREETKRSKLENHLQEDEDFTEKTPDQLDVNCQILANPESKQQHCLKDGENTQIDTITKTSAYPIENSITEGENDSEQAESVSLLQESVMFSHDSRNVEEIGNDNVRENIANCDKELCSSNTISSSLAAHELGKVIVEPKDQLKNVKSVPSSSKNIIPETPKILPSEISQTGNWEGKCANPKSDLKEGFLPGKKDESLTSTIEKVIGIVQETPLLEQFKSPNVVVHADPEVHTDDGNAKTKKGRSTRKSQRIQKKSLEIQEPSKKDTKLTRQTEKLARPIVLTEEIPIADQHLACDDQANDDTLDTDSKLTMPAQSCLTDTNNTQWSNPKDPKLVEQTVIDEKCTSPSSMPTENERNTSTADCPNKTVKNADVCNKVDVSQRNNCHSDPGNVSENNEHHPGIAEQQPQPTKSNRTPVVPESVEVTLTNQSPLVTRSRGSGTESDSSHGTIIPNSTDGSITKSNETVLPNSGLLAPSNCETSSIPSDESIVYPIKNSVANPKQEILGTESQDGPEEKKATQGVIIKTSGSSNTLPCTPRRETRSRESVMAHDALKESKDCELNFITRDESKDGKTLDGPERSKDLMQKCSFGMQYPSQHRKPETTPTNTVIPGIRFGNQALARDLLSAKTSTVIPYSPMDVTPGPINALCHRCKRKINTDAYVSQADGTKNSSDGFLKEKLTPVLIEKVSRKTSCLSIAKSLRPGFDGENVQQGFDHTQNEMNNKLFSDVTARSSHVKELNSKLSKNAKEGIYLNGKEVGGKRPSEVCSKVGGDVSWEGNNCEGTLSSHIKTYELRTQDDARSLHEESTQSVVQRSQLKPWQLHNEESDNAKGEETRDSVVSAKDEVKLKESQVMYVKEMREGQSLPDTFYSEDDGLGEQCKDDFHATEEVTVENAIPYKDNNSKSEVNQLNPCGFSRKDDVITDSSKRKISPKFDEGLFQSDGNSDSSEDRTPELKDLDSQMFDDEQKRPAIEEKLISHNSQFSSWKGSLERDDRSRTDDSDEIRRRVRKYRTSSIHGYSKHKRIRRSRKVLSSESEDEETQKTSPPSPTPPSYVSLKVKMVSPVDDKIHALKALLHDNEGEQKTNTSKRRNDNVVKVRSQNDNEATRSAKRSFDATESSDSLLPASKRKKESNDVNCVDGRTVVANSDEDAELNVNEENRLDQVAMEFKRSVGDNIRTPVHSKSGPTPNKTKTKTPLTIYSHRYQLVPVDSETVLNETKTLGSKNPISSPATTPKIGLVEKQDQNQIPVQPLFESKERGIPSRVGTPILQQVKDNSEKNIHVEEKNIQKPLPTCEENTTLKFVFTPSRLNRQQMLYCKALSDRVGGSFSPDFKQDKTTHLVMPTDENMCIQRDSYTYKYMMALVSGTWIVSFKWIIASLKAGKFIDETNFQVKGDVASHHMHIPRFAKEAADKRAKGLLDGYSLILKGDFKQCQVTKEQLVKTAEKCGATILPEPLHGLSEEQLLVTDGSDKQLVQDSLRMGLVVVTHEWVIESVINFSIQDPTTFLPKS